MFMYIQKSITSNIGQIYIAYCTLTFSDCAVARYRIFSLLSADQCIYLVQVASLQQASYNVLSYAVLNNEVEHRLVFVQTSVHFLNTHDALFPSCQWYSQCHNGRQPLLHSWCSHRSHTHSEVQVDVHILALREIRQQPV